MTTQSLLDRTPPQSPEAEMSLLGSLILDPNQIRQVGRVVVSSDFYDERHVAIFDSIERITSKAPVLDLVILADDLGKRGVLDRCGGPDYLVKLAESVPSSVNAQHYAGIVRDKADRRRLINACATAMHAAYTSTTDTVDLATESCSQIAKIATGRRIGQNVTMRQVIKKHVEDMESDTQFFYTTGIRTFDRMFSGIPREGVLTINGANSSGKSSLAGNIVCELAYRHGASGRVHSYELGDLAAITMACGETRTPWMELRKRHREPTAEEWQKILEFHDRDGSERICFARESMTARQMYAQAAADKEAGHSWVLIDYAQSIVSEHSGRSETESAKVNCQWLQRIHRDLGMLVILVSQVTTEVKRGVTDGKGVKPPRLTDCVWGGDIANITTMHIGVLRPCQYMRPEDVTDWGEAVLNVSKNKNDKVGQLPVRFDGKYFKFSDAQATSWASASMGTGGNDAWERES